MSIKTPFRQKNLLGIDQFSRYCEENAVRVSRKKLEELHKEGLLYPVIRLRMGFDMMEIDGKKQYIGGSYIVKGNDWIDKGFLSSDIDYPPELPFFEWKERHPAGIPMEDPKQIEDDYELFYDKHQLYALIIIRRWKQHQLSEDEPKEFEHKIRNQLEEFYRFIALFMEMEDRWKEYKQWRRESYIELVKEYEGDEKEAKDEWLARHEVQEEPKMKKWADKLLQKHQLSEKDIDRWRFFLAEQSFFNRLKPNHKARTAYILAVDDSVLIKAEEANRMIFVLNQLLYMLRGELRTVQNVIGHFLEPRCEICHMPIESDPRIAIQYTCGKVDCKNEHRNRKKREDRKKMKQTESVA